MIQVINHRYGNRAVPDITGVAPESQAIVFLDPPYNFGVKYEDDPSSDKMDPESYRALMHKAAATCAKTLRPGGTLWYLCPADHVDFVPAMLASLGLVKLYMIVKEETFAQYQQKSLTEDYRLLFVYYKPGAPLTFNPDDIRIPSARLLQAKPDKRADPRGRVPGQVWKVRRLQGTSDDHVKWHPCQLPPELLERIIKGFSNKGDSVLDGFAGSGNMGIAARLFGRDAVLVDGSPTYCTKMKKRLGLAA